MARILLVGVVIAAVAISPAVAQYDDDAMQPKVGSPSVLGPTGALITPTTQIDPKMYSVGYHWLNDTFDALVSVNVAPIERLELGATYIEPAAAGADHETVFNAKYALADEDDDSPALSVGVWDISDELDQTWYGVVSKTIDGEVPITINLGGGTGDVLNGFFGSVILGLHDDVDFIGEYDSEEINFGLRVYPYDKITLDAYSVDNGIDREFGIGAAYTDAW